MHLRTAFLWTMIGSLTIAAGMGVVAIVFDYGRMAERILVTSLLVGAFSITALGCAILVDRRVRPAVMWTGIVASGASLALWVLLVWFEQQLRRGGPDLDDLVGKVGTATTAVALWAPHLGLLKALRLHAAVPRRVRTVTFLLAAALAVAVVGVIWFEEFEDWTAKLLGVLALLTACGTVVTPMLWMVERIHGRGSAESIERRVRVWLRCPRCHLEQLIPAGRARCGRCGLKIALDVQEPRCRCGYLLYQLAGETCPECGAPIDPADRWEEPAALSTTPPSDQATERPSD